MELTHSHSNTKRCTDSGVQRGSQTLLRLTHTLYSTLLAPRLVLLGVCILLCFASVWTEQEEIKAALLVCLQPTLL